ncbi:Uncharacterised protein [Corynebacterium renale]|nr:Uncharacterised protein [Corynebacterium renale]STD70268.1 Uncharacterised protein [Corynebacterium renale]
MRFEDLAAAVGTLRGVTDLLDGMCSLVQEPDDPRYEGFVVALENARDGVSNAEEIGRRLV